MQYFGLASGRKDRHMMRHLCRSTEILGDCSLQAGQWPTVVESDSQHLLVMSVVGCCSRCCVGVVGTTSCAGVSRVFKDSALKVLAVNK